MFIVYSKELKIIVIATLSYVQQFLIAKRFLFPSSQFQDSGIK